MTPQAALAAFKRAVAPPSPPEPFDPTWVAYRASLPDNPGPRHWHGHFNGYTFQCPWCANRRRTPAWAARHIDSGIEATWAGITFLWRRDGILFAINGDIPSAHLNDIAVAYRSGTILGGDTHLTVPLNEREQAILDAIGQPHPDLHHEFLAA